MGYSFLTQLWSQNWLQVLWGSKCTHRREKYLTQKEKKSFEQTNDYLEKRNKDPQYKHDECATWEWNLIYELGQLRKQIRMLNSGYSNSDEILSVGEPYKGCTCLG